MASNNGEQGRELSPVKTRSVRTKEKENAQNPEENKIDTCKESQFDREVNNERHNEEVEQSSCFMQSHGHGHGASVVRSVKSKLSREQKSRRSHTSSKRNLIEARKVAKQAQIKLEAAKYEAQLREREMQLENERKIKQYQFEVEIANIELEAEQSLTESESNTSSSKDLKDNKSKATKSSVVLSNLPKESENDRVKRLLDNMKVDEKPESKDVRETPEDVQDPKNGLLKAEGEQSSFLRLGETIAKQQKPAIKVFHGAPDKFVSFKASFERLKRKKLYDEDELLDLLLEHVGGEAEKAVSGILPGSGQFQRAMAILQERFGNARTIVNANLAALRSHVVVQERKADQLRSLSHVISTMIESFKSLNLHYELKSSSVVQDAVAKLPSSLFYRWHDWACDHPDQTSLEDFHRWLERKAKQMEEAQLSASVIKKGQDNKFKKDDGPTQHTRRPNYFAGRVDSKREVAYGKCPIHDSPNHSLEKCKVFQGMNPTEKESVVRKYRLCYCCLSVGHMARNCKRKKRCETMECKYRHHYLLHDIVALRHESQQPEKQQPHLQQSQQFEQLANTAFASQKESPIEHNQIQQLRQSETPTSSTHLESEVPKKVAYHGSQQNKALLQVLPIILHGRNGQQCNVLAMLDSGCDCTLISVNMASQLGLISSNDKSQSVKITGVNGTQTVDSFTIAQPIYVSSPDNPYKKFALFDTQTVPNLPGPSYTVEWSEVKEKFKYLRDVDLPDVNGEEISILIGSNNGRLLIPCEIVEPSPGPGTTRLPIALRTPLGWVATNCLPAVFKSHAITAFRTRIEREEDTELRKLVESSMSVDILGISNNLPSVTRSREDDRAFLKMKATTYKLPNEDAYVSPLLWKDKEPRLPDNYDGAVRRLSSLERKLERDTNLRNRYQQSIETDIKKGYIRKLSQEEAALPSPVKWYLPHHPVINPRKPERLRRVYDASAVFHGSSLNKAIHKGPDLLPLLLGVLLRFCEKPFAIAADIQEMYHQIRVAEFDKAALRFLWREHPTMEIEVYQFERMLFGEIGAPSRANYVIRLNAKDHEDLYPLVAKLIERWFYMDDAMGSVDSIEEGVERVQQLTELLSKGGFRLHKWLSNSVEILRCIPEEERSAKVRNLSTDVLPTERTLGVYWDAQADSFKFMVSCLQPGNTHRKILSQIFSIWDPRGLISPFIIRARIYLQKLWMDNGQRKKEDKLGWDIPIPSEKLTEWYAWWDEAQHLSQVVLPRPFRTRTEKPSSSDLMIFCDASEKAYGMCAYLLHSYADGQRECNLVVAKARVAPLKKLTIPRLELLGAVIAVRMAETLVEELETEVQRIILWCDSAIVLQWMNKASSCFHTFVANRIAEIEDTLTRLREKFGEEQVTFRYIPSPLNPADDTTRGLRLLQLTPNSRWHRGPDFLRNDKEWPERRFEPVSEPQEEYKQVKWVGLLQSNQDEEIFKVSKYSSLNKLRRVVAYCHRFVYNAQRPITDRVFGPLQVWELAAAMKTLLKRAQEESFNEEMEVLHAGKPILARSRLIKLDPKLESGILVVGGRLNYAALPRMTKNPIILSSKHHLSRLIVDDYHKMYRHPGTNFLLYMLRRRYWIVRARNLIRQHKFNCVECKKSNPKTITPHMADLPAFRVTPGKFFDQVGVDYFGPVLVKQGRSTLKRYGCIFTCLKIRAVHIELAESLEADSFILCLRNFIGRRGQPSDMYSDNGSNFVGAERELRQGLINLNQEKIENFLAPKMIQWHFNPPYAPHMGGVWERMVQSSKRALYAILKGRTVTHEVLRTALIEVEALLNSRPIGYVPADAEDVEPLSPFHFLLIRPHCNLSIDVVHPREINARKQWKRVQALVNSFWKRWMREYVPGLTERSKWNRSQPNLKEGDVVLLIDSAQSRGQWLLGRVHRVRPGKDGVIRSAEVKTKFGNCLRPVNKMCLLEECPPIST